MGPLEDAASNSRALLTEGPITSLLCPWRIEQQPLQHFTLLATCMSCFTFDFAGAGLPLTAWAWLQRVCSGLLG